MIKALRLLTILLLSSFVYASSLSAATPITLLGTIALPKSVANVATLIGYYKGAKIDIHNGSFTLKDTPSLDDLYILFTLDPVRPQSTNDEDINTFTHFRMAHSAHYKAFKVRKNPGYWSTRYSPAYNKRANCPAQFKEIWMIEPYTLSKRGDFLNLPDNTLIISINPSFVAKLEQAPWDCEINTIKLPTIVLRPTMNANEVKTMVAESACASIDVACFHRKPTVIKATNPETPQVVLSLVTD